MCCYISVIHNKYLIAVFDCRKSVCNNNESPSCNKLCNRILQNSFILRICVCSCLVKDNNWCIFKHSSCNRNTLSLTSGKMSSGSSDNCIKSIFKLHDKIIAATLFCYFNDLLISGILITLSDVFANRLVEKIIILRHICNFLIKISK